MVLYVKVIKYFWITFNFNICYREDINYKVNDASDITFEIYDKSDNSLVGTYTSDSKGFFSVTLSTGKYLMRQITDVEGYYFSTDVNLEVKPDVDNQFYHIYLVRHYNKFKINRCEILFQLKIK